MGAAAFSIVPRHVIAGSEQTPPSGKLNIAGIGLGGMGHGDLSNFVGENIVALCDVDHLFAGDLSNAEAPAGVWAWKDGVLSPSKKDECIWTKKEYENFVLDLEFKVEPGANSGVLVYNTDMKQWIPNTVEIQVLDEHSPKWATAAPTWKCGAIFGHSVPKVSAVKKAGEWNRMTLECRGPKITVVINGQQVTDINMKDWTSGKKNPDGSSIPPWQPRPMAEMPTKGHIGLQGAHGGIATHYRNMSIRSLD